MNQNFLIKSVRILVELTKILIDIIILINIRILVDFIRNILSTRIPIISTRILINLIRKFRSSIINQKFFFSIRYLYQWTRYSILC